MVMEFLKTKNCYSYPFFLDGIALCNTKNFLIDISFALFLVFWRCLLQLTFVSWWVTLSVTEYKQDITHSLFPFELGDCDVKCVHVIKETLSQKE